MQRHESCTHVFGLPQGERTLAGADAQAVHRSGVRLGGERDGFRHYRYNSTKPCCVRLAIILRRKRSSNHTVRIFPAMFRSRLPEFLFVALTLLLPGCSQARDALPPAVDLRADGRLARAQRLPIVLFFHSTTFPFCRAVEDLSLARLQKGNESGAEFLLRPAE